jgi:uncharacterized protein YndB with AHSA1/START domain
VRTLSPITFTNTVTIDRPLAEVFAFLAQFENVPRWNYAISQTRKISSGPVRVGSQYRQTRTLPRRSEETFEVTEFEPDRRISIRGTLGPFPAELTYALDRTGDATTLTNAVDLQTPGLLSAVAPLATGRIKSAVAANLDSLRQILERDGSK